MIELIDVRKAFGQHQVLKGICLKVATGTTRVILGLSGSGKSVIMKLIIGLLSPDSGQILIDNEDITQLNTKQMQRIRRKFGMVFQQAALFDSMTVEQNVAFPLREHSHLSEAEINAKVAEKLALVNLLGMEKKYPAELSGGMRKRVGLARAVILDPTCVLYDEPTTGLDPLTTDNVDQMILEAKKHFNVTSLIISHDLRSAFKVGEYISVIHEGRIVEDCATQDIYRSQNLFVQKILHTVYEQK